MITRFLKRFGHVHPWQIYFQRFMKDGVITNDPNAYACDTWDILLGRIMQYTRDVHLVATDFTNKVPPGLQALCFEKSQAEIASLKAIIATRDAKDAKAAAPATTRNHRRRVIPRRRHLRAGNKPTRKPIRKD